MTKKEKKLYFQHGRKWDVRVFYKITICNRDVENIFKCSDFLVDHNCLALKRVTRRIKVFNKYIYINTLYGGIDD